MELLLQRTPSDKRSNYSAPTTYDIKGPNEVGKNDEEDLITTKNNHNMFYHSLCLLIDTTTTTPDQRYGLHDLRR